MLENIPLVEADDRVIAAARFYIAHRLIPRSSAADALHLALASVHGADYVLTWNCRHLANANKARHIAVLNTRLRLPVPLVTTPLTLLPEEPLDGPTQHQA